MLFQKQVRPLGTVVLKTTCAPDDNAATALAAVANAVVVKELKIAGSRCGPHPMALEMLAEPGLLDVEKCVSHQWPDVTPIAASSGTYASHTHSMYLSGLRRYIEDEYTLAEADAAFDHAKRRGAMKVQIVMPDVALGSQSRGSVRAAGVAAMRSQTQLGSATPDSEADCSLGACTSEGRVCGGIIRPRL